MNFYNKEKSTSFILIILVVIFLVSTVLAIGMGSVSVKPTDTINILLSRVPFINSFIPITWDSLDEKIILQLRFPRVLLGMVVGASLSVCGVAMQALIRNTLADPYILGVSSGASAFATLAMLFGSFTYLGVFYLSISAFIGAMLTIVLVYFISYEKGKVNITKLLLIGVVVSMIMNGVTSVIKLSAPNALGLHNAEFWLSGSLVGARWEYLPLPFFVLIFTIIFLSINHRGLDLMLFGEEAAISLGVNVKLLQKQLIVISSLLAGVTIAVSGAIGFVGLIVPHFTRLLVGGSHKKVIPISAFLGGILVIWVDVIGRTIIAPEELPVGILTAIIGGPVFIIILKKRGIF